MAEEERRLIYFSPLEHIPKMGQTETLFILDGGFQV